MNTALKTYPALENFYDALTNIDRRVLTEKKQSDLKNSPSRLEGFKPITHGDMEKIMPYLVMETGRTTDFSYAGILMWVDYFKYEYAIVEDTLFIKGTVEDDTSKPAFSLPVGRLSLPESIGMIREYCSHNGIKPELSAVPEYALPDFIDMGINEIQPLEDWGDYLYDAEMLSTLKGKKMSKKRNHVNKFDSLYPDYRIEALNASNIDKAIRFMDTIDEEGDSTPMAIEERKMTRLILDYMKEGDRNLIGIIMTVGDEVAAFTIGDVKNDTLYVHIEKASRKFEGSYEKINKEFAAIVRDLHPEVMYINREDDSGDEGLRRAKQSYHPIEILRKYNIII